MNDRAGGLLATAGAALSAGLVVGLLQGLADGALALARTDTTGFETSLGCLAGAVVWYGAAWSALLCAAGLALHPLLRSKSLAGRRSTLLGLGLGLALFFEVYWWSRPYVLWGRPATDPRRLAAAGAMLLVGLVLGLVAARLLVRLPRKTRWAGAGLIPLAWILGLAYLPRSGSAAAARGIVNERTREMPSVLLFVVDALRADVLGCYGSPRVHTPRIDALAARGVLFENAWAQAPFTWSSFGSILTGKYPRRHGLVRMEPGRRMAPNVTLPWHLKSARFRAGRAPAGQAALRDGDYAGAAFMTGTLSHGSGLVRGFDVYYEAMVGHDLVAVDDPWSVFRSELLLFLVREKLEQRFDRHPAATAAREWIEANGERRFVALVHYYSTHTPYDPPEEFRRRYCDPAYAGPIRSFYSDARIAIERGEYAPTPADVEQIRNLYYAGVAQADAMIGDVLDALERRGALDDTVVVVTADHGEELGDHGLWEHNHMFETNLRVPLVVVWPRGLPEGVRVKAPVESVDLVPTLCALLGVEVPFEEGQRDERGRERGIVDGVDLLPLARGEVESAKPFCFSENGEFLAVRDERWKLIVPAPALSAQGWSDLRAEKLPPQVGAARLFDLVSDPGETRDQLAEEPEEAERLLAELRRWDDLLPVPRSAVIKSDRDLEAQFRRLGYAGGVGGDPGAAPKDGQ